MSRHARPCAGHPRLYNRKASKSWMAGTSPAMTERLIQRATAKYNDPPHRYPDRADRDPDVVAVVGDDGCDRQDSGVSARGHDIRDRGCGCVRKLHLAAGRVWRPAAAAARLD